MEQWLLLHWVNMDCGRLTIDQAVKLPIDILSYATDAYLPIRDLAVMGTKKARCPFSFRVPETSFV
jgi:hypothetical protein